MRHRIFRAIVFFLAGWPLFMPPGVCVCQFVRAGEASPRTLERLCTDGQENGCTASPGDEG
jgi:hypothetical protein